MGSLYVVSDIHGHLGDLVEGLTEAGLLDGRGDWCGDDDQLWVLGDLTDRGPDGIGVVDLLRRLQEQAPGHVHVLMGNHEILALGVRRFPESRFADTWFINGGRLSDQVGLTDEHERWLASLPLVGRVGDFLLQHSDTTEYLTWGTTIEQVNATVAEKLADARDERAHWEVWSRLTSRYRFVGEPGEDMAQDLLRALGGEVVVHGHSIIGSLTEVPSSEVSEPVLYAGGRALAIDGGRYDGGPLLVVRLTDLD